MEIEILEAFLDRREKAVIVQGGPGVGKSTQIRALADRFPGQYALASTTGVSAINLGGGTTTIHSLLKVKDTETLVRHAQSGALLTNLERLSMGYAGIIIDEYSMLPADFLDILFYTMKILEERLRSRDIEPMRLILVGDILQLPPVNADYCFKADCIDEFRVHTLDKVYRQRDAAFIEALSHVRMGRGEECVDFFEEMGFHREIDENFPGPVLMPRNKHVDEYNNRKLKALPGESKYYYPKKLGEQKGEWTTIPSSLELRVGAPVIVLVNKRSLGYMNGDLGRIVRMGFNSIEVILERDGSRVEVTYATLENEDEHGKSRGSISFLPIRLGYAITYHKVQSMTLKYVQANINDTFMMQQNPGMLGMGLTRAISPEGLRIVCDDRERFLAACRSSPECLAWLSGLPAHQRG